MRSMRQAGHRLSKRTVLVGAAALVAVPLAAAAADASTSAGGTVNGCYVKTTGSLRVIHPGQSGTQGHCTTSETPISWNQVGPQGPRGPQGLPGVQGVQGAQGIQGVPGVSGYQEVKAVADPVLPGSGQQAAATCPAGTVPLGGGFFAGGPVEVLLDGPAPFDSPPTSWSVIVQNPTSETLTLTVYALCANA